MKLELLQRSQDGTLSPVTGAVFPSLPSPIVKVTDFKVMNLRKNPRDENAYLCDVSAVGTVNEGLCDLISKAGGTIAKIRLHVNDSDQPLGEFPIAVTKLSSGTAARPYPFDGQFSFTATAVSITEGNNTFRILAQDEVYGLSGYSLWVCSFAFPYDGEYEEADDEEKVFEPKIVEGPKWIAGGTGGETMVYCFAIPQDQKPNTHSLMVSGQKGVKLGFRDDPTHQRSIAVWPDTGLPAFFTVRPTMAISRNVLKDVSVIRGLSTHPKLQGMNERDQFYYGFGQGLAYEGYDLVFNADAIAVAGARLSADGRGIAFDAKLVNEADGSARGLSPFVPSLEGRPFATLEADSTPMLFAYFAELFRHSDPRAEEMVLAILIGDYTDVGLPELRIGDWREHLYSGVAELSEVLITDIKQSPPLEQGYFLGRLVGDGMRMNVDPRRPDRIEDIRKGEFLLRLGKMPFCSPENRHQHAVDKPLSLMDRIRSMFR